VGIHCEQSGDSPGAEADVSQFNDAPAGLLFGRVFARGPKTNQQVLRAQSLLEALGMGGGLEGEAEGWRRGPGGSRGLLGSLPMALQGLGGEVMLGEHALNPSVIDGIVVAIPHNPCQFTSGKGMRYRQPHDMLLDVPREEHGCPRLPSRVRQGALIDQA
jgi:hypothetical protein